MTTLLDAALSYAQQGWKVFPCHNPIPGTPVRCSCRNPECATIGKHPRTRNGLLDATDDLNKVRQWWTTFPDANIAAFPASVGMIAFDLDTDDAIASAKAMGLFAEPTFEVATGNGVHRYYKHPALPNGATIGGIIARSAHGYVLLPPSKHANGRTYAISDPSDAIPLPPLALEKAQQVASREGQKERVHLAITSSQIAQGDRHNALLSLAGSLAARGVPTEHALALVLSHNDARCSPPKPHDEVQKLVAFAYEQEQAKHAEVARHLVLATTHTPAIVRPSPAPLTNPLEYALPGVLEPLVQWSLATAPHPVRTYAVAAALALASVVCARRYATTRANYSSLYFLVVGTSGTGKEHVRRTVNAVLRAANAAHLIGPNEWTSRSAVWSSVLQQPQSVAIVDEFGQFLGAASGNSDGATMKNGVLTAMMELFGRLDDTAITPQFSTLNLSEKQRKAAERKQIERPALSVVGLTTPNEWYESLKGNRISSGFLNRFLVMEADAQRGELNDVEHTDPPVIVTEWVRQLLAPHYELDIPNRLDGLPAPKRLTIADEAMHVFRAYKRECNARADLLEREQLGELPMRAAEQAMRLALIAALADVPDATHIEPLAAEWGVAVADYQLQRLIPAIRDRVSENPVHALRNRFLAALREAGVKGLTERELMRSPLFRGTSKRDRDETIQWAQEAGYAAWGDVPHSSAGRPRWALQILTIVANEEAA